MKLRLLYAVFVVGSLACSNSTADPIASCEAVCESQKTGGCVAAAFDCADSCSTAQADYEANRGMAETEGCASEFDSYFDCTSDDSDACDTTRCTAELNTYSECIARP